MYIHMHVQNKRQLEMTKSGTFSVNIIRSMKTVHVRREPLELATGKLPVKIVRFGTNMGKKLLVSKRIWFFTKVVAPVLSRPAGLFMNTTPTMLLLIRYSLILQSFFSYYQIFINQGSVWYLNVIQLLWNRSYSI